MKVDLEFNIESLKITDLPEDEQESAGGGNRSNNTSLIESLKRKSDMQRDNPSDGTPVGKVRGEVQSTKLREILNSMSNEDEV